MKRMAELLAKYESLGLTLQSLQTCLARSRQFLDSLPASNGRNGLLGLTEYLARQTDALGVCA